MQMPITKTEITEGVYWIEIPDADVRILCAAPSDVVKHLKKKGFINTEDENGVSFESGPNVLLLSDLAIQNGDFSNLGEFPVLQMLYKQGMIIPNHPNNKGQKPLIVGSEEQVKAQLEYIYRGNYGLVSEEEIMEAGIDADLAKIMMDVKLQFAFGKIRQSDELLDSRIVGSEEVELINGVTIERRTTNVFTIRYKEYSTKVNLNLPFNGRYESPYPLGFNNPERKYFSIIQSGQGDGWDINRPSMSSIIMFQGKIYLIDAGPNLDYILMTLGIGINEIEGIFHTHCHDDHFSGLVKLIQSDHRIKYFATPLVRHSVTKKFSALMGIEENLFEDYFDIHDLEFDTWNAVQGISVKPLYGPHPVENNLFYFRVPYMNGYKTYAHLADLTAFSILEKMVEKSEILSDQWLAGIKQNYLEYADIKKIDIGGGMIHGVAEDFQEDPSERVILAHKEARLSNSEKEIGSSSPFGMVDELIPDYQEYTYRSAFHYLTVYFKDVSSEEINIILSNPVVTFAPGTNIMKQGDPSEYIYLLITGNVECISTHNQEYFVLSAGTFIQDLMSALMNISAQYTFKALSFARALKIPRKLLLNFINHNVYYAEMEKKEDLRYFLEQSTVFGKNVSLPVMYKVIENIEEFSLADKVTMPVPNNKLFIVKEGYVTLTFNHKSRKMLNAGDFIFTPDFIKTSMQPEIKALEDATLISIDLHVLHSIPIIYLKAIEMITKVLASERQTNSSSSRR